MFVIFENPGEIDIRLISSFGVNVKEKDSPIGYFGTGMKYALAILMRKGASVDVVIGEKIHKVGIVKETIRGREFSFITLGGETLNFTTELGKDWDFWTSYRELYTNGIDEEGIVYALEHYIPQQGTTKIVVAHDDFLEIHHNKKNYFLQTKLLWKGDDVSIHEGENTAVFFQKIRVLDLPDDSKSLFSYDLKSTELTEDRTIKNTWSTLRAIANVLSQCDDEELIREAVTARIGTLENVLDYSFIYKAPTPEFLRVAKDVIRSGITDLNPTILALVDKFSVPTLPEAVELDDIQKEMLKRALSFWGKSGFDIAKWQIRTVKSLGDGTLGIAKKGIIFVSLTAFESGVKQLAITLFEEFIHLEYKVYDCTRSMQEKLFHIIAGQAEKNNGEPL